MPERKAEVLEPPAAAVAMPKKAGKKGVAVSAYSKADAFGGSKYEVSHIVGRGAYGVVW